MSIDYEGATVLMDFIEAASKHGTRYNVLIGDAQAELDVMQNDVKVAKAKEAAAMKAKAEYVPSTRPVPTGQDELGKPIPVEEPSTDRRSL